MSSATNNVILFVMRILMAWTFLYAASHQIFDPDFSIVGFLSHTRTFHGFFSLFTGPQIAPVIGFLVGYGHLLIGLSLLTGLLVRVSGVFGIALLLTYLMAHMDFPYIENANNFLVDYHIVYSVVLSYLIVNRAGHVFGLDAIAHKLRFVACNPRLSAVT